MIRLRWEIAALLIVVIVSAAFVPSFSAHVHTGEPLVPASWRTENPGPYVLDVTVALDEEWTDSHGAAADQLAERVIAIAASNLRPAGLDLRISRSTQWT